MRPGATPYNPKILFAAQESIFLGNDPLFDLLGKTTGFSLRFRGDYSLDGGILIRDRVLTYRVEGDQLTRINPVATSAEDFLDEWINMPRRDAARWSDPSELAGLVRWHSLAHEKEILEFGWLVVRADL